MLGYNTEFYWISTLPSPKYRLVLLCTNPVEFSTACIINDPFFISHLHLEMTKTTNM